MKRDLKILISSLNKTFEALKIRFACEILAPSPIPLKIEKKTSRFYFTLFFQGRVLSGARIRMYCNSCFVE